MEENPYQSPVHQSPVAPAGTKRRRPGLGFGFGWLVFLLLNLPTIYRGHLLEASHHAIPAGTYLWTKIITTLISTMAGFVLIFVPRGWWKVASIALVGILVFVQVAYWLWLP